jgi:hypothetical protein
MLHNSWDYWVMDFVHRPEFYITVYVSETLCFSSYSEFRTMDKFHKSSDSE